MMSGLPKDARMSSEFVAHSTYKTNHSSAFRFVLSHILRHPWVAIGLLVGALANAIGAALLPIYTGRAVNAVADGGGDLNIVINLVIAIFVSQFIRGVLQFMRNLCSEIYGQLIERDVRDELYASLLGKSMTFHDRLPVGEIMARVTNDVREMNLMMNPGLNILIGSGMFLIMPVIAAPTIHPSLIIVPLIFVVLQVVIQVRFITSLHPVAEEVRANFGRMNARLAEALDGLQVIKGAAQEDNEKATFNALADAVRDRFIQQGGIEARYLANLTFPLTVVAGFVHSIYLYNLGQINTGDVIAFISLLYLFTFPVFSSMFSLPRIALGYASAARILNIITAETDLDQNSEGYEQPIRGEITFENVSFGYSADKETLHDISFSVKPGQTVAIVGQTGAGKTTITKLINRTYDATAGRVLVDGVDVRDWKLEALRSQISVIEQDIFLFSRTIAENIAFGTQEIEQPQIEDAARKAQAHHFIESFNEGYQTVIGQRGVTLSGGQRQRIAIARAFQTDPPVLILDDSTSAIDSATEDLIQKAIWTASRGRTTILITHRLSQIRWADHIVVLRQGRVVAQGAHEDLLKSSEAYRRIFARYEDAHAVNGSRATT
jgi:ATP-binding cassette subfamily B protein